MLPLTKQTSVDKRTFPTAQEAKSSKLLTS
jgi:hypothetical protein